MRDPNIYAASGRVALAAGAVSVALHLAALFGTPAFDLRAPDEKLARLDAVLRELPAPRVAPPAQPVKRRPVASTTPVPQEQPMPEPTRADPSESDEPPQDALAAEGELALPPEMADMDQAAPAHYPIHHLRLVYDLFYGQNQIRVGRVVHTWASDDEHYRVESVAEATGFFGALYGGKFVQRATGGFGPRGLVPAEYVLERGSPDNAETARFDWPAAKLTLARKGESSVVDLPEGAHDALSMMHQLYFMQPLPPSAELRVATSRKIGAHVYQVTGEAQVDTPMGVLAAVHIRRVSDDGDRMELWLDPKHAMLPLRVLAVDNKGTLLDQRIRGIEVEPLATAGVALQ